MSLLVLASSGSGSTGGVIGGIGFIAIGVCLVARREDVALKRQATARKRGSDPSSFVYQAQWAVVSGIALVVIGAILVIGFLA